MQDCTGEGSRRELTKLSKIKPKDLTFQDLSDDLLLEVMSHFCAYSLTRFASVSKASAPRTMNQNFWKRLCQQKWPSLMPFLRDSVIFGNYQHLYKTRTIALAPYDEKEEDKSSKCDLLEDYVFSLTFTSSAHDQDFDSITHSFVLTPAPTQVEITLPFDMDTGELTLECSIYQRSTNATVQLDMVEGRYCWWVNGNLALNNEEQPVIQWLDQLNLSSVFNVEMDDYIDNTHELAILLYEVDDNGCLLCAKLNEMTLKDLKAEALRVNATCAGNKSIKFNWINAIKRALNAKRTVRVEIQSASVEMNHPLITRANSIPRIKDVVDTFMKFRV